MSTGFKDPEGNFPRSEYEQQPTTNKAARGEWEPRIVYPPVPEGVDLPPQDWEPEYPHNKVEESKSGHRIEVDDTPEAERLTWTHADGHGIEMYPGEGEDGMLINTVGRMVKLVGNGFLMVVNGNGDITYTGNLNLNVTGDFNIKCNNFTLETQGKQVEEIKQEKVENFVGDRVVTTQGSKSEVVLGDYTVESMKTTHIVSKNDLKISAPGDIEIIAGGEIRETAEERITSSAPENFMLGDCTTVAGGKGTIGGENHVFYAKSTHSETVDATTVRADGFIGDLRGNVNGNADTATTAATAGALGSGGGGGSANVTDQAASETAKPTHSNMNEALNQTKTLGVRKVEVDDGKISQSVKGEGGSSGESTTSNEQTRPDTFGDGEPPATTGSITEKQRAQLQQAEAQGLLGGSTAAEVETAINDVAREIGADPAAVAAVIKTESAFDYPYSMTNSQYYKGAFQMGEATWGHTADGSGTLGGLTWSQYQNASFADQIRAYPDWSRAHGIDGIWKNNLHNYDVATQAALIQGAQFSPGVVSGRNTDRTQWWTGFNNGNFNLSTDDRGTQADYLRYDGDIRRPTIQSMIDYYGGIL